MIRIPRKHRIGIDIDSKNQFEMLKRYFNSKRFGESLVYETKHGYHIQIYKKNRTSKENMLIRHILNDCNNRLDLDVGRLNENLDDIIETLFEYKKIDDDEGVETLINPLSLPFWGLSEQ